MIARASGHGKLFPVRRPQDAGGFPRRRPVPVARKDRNDWNNWKEKQGNDTVDTNKEKKSQEGMAEGMAEPRPGAGSTHLPPSRQGKKAVTAYVDPEMHKQLRLLGVELGKSSQEMIIEALDHYFERLEREG
jgi:hypothetical protein